MERKSSANVVALLSDQPSLYPSKEPSDQPSVSPSDQPSSCVDEADWVVSDTLIFSFYKGVNCAELEALE